MSTVKWARSIPGGKRGGSGNEWTRTIPADLIREMRLNPQVTFQLFDADGEPLEFSPKKVTALAVVCPRPYRVQSRYVGNDRTARHVWVSMDPGHWERHEQKKKEQETTSE